VTQPNGTVNVDVGGVTLVQGTWNDTIETHGGTGDMSLVAHASGATIPASAGSVSGQLAAINQYLPAYQSQLDTAANDLASTVNTQLAAGYTATGASGSASPLFQGSGAAGITVNAAVVANPQLIAASGTATLPDATNDGSNAQAMAELYNSPTGPDQQYQSLIQGLGSQVQAVNSQVQSQTSVANAAQENLQSIEGVNTNDEMVQMLTFQQAYQASAKLVSTVDTMMQSLIQAS
jgi:flagellar hook-associated protein 1 FlgK